MPRSGWRSLDEALGSRNGGVTPIDDRFNGAAFIFKVKDLPRWQGSWTQAVRSEWNPHPCVQRNAGYKDSPPSPAISATKETFASDDKSQPLWLRLGPALLNDCRLWIWVCPFSWLNILNPHISIQKCPCAKGNHRWPVSNFGTHDIFIWGRPARHRPAYHPGLFKVCCASHRIFQIYEVQVRRES